MSGIAVVRNRLTTATDVSSKVGSRVYAVRAPQQPTTPYQVVRIISRPETHTMTADLGHVMARVEVSSFATGYDDCEDLALAARAALNNWRGTATGTVVNGVFLDNERDQFEDSVSNDDRWIWRKDQDYLVHYEE